MFFPKTEWINPVQDVGTQLIRILSTCKANWVLRNEQTGAWIEVPMPVIVQVRFGIEILSLQPQPLLNRPDLDPIDSPGHTIMRLPNDCSSAIT